LGAVLAVLLAWVLARKALRDTVEGHGAERREDLAGALAARDAVPLLSATGGTRREQEDAIAVLRGPGAPPPPPVPLSPALIRQLSSHRASARGRAVVLLGLLGASEARAEIAAMLRDPDADVRLAAASALEDLADPWLAKTLLEALVEGLLSATQVIERIAHPWAIESILDQSPALAPEALAALWRAAGLAGASVAAPRLRSALRHGTDEERIRAARALGELEDRTAEADLCAALEDPRWEVRAQAATALGRLGAFSSVPLLEVAMRDSAWWVRANAANALACLDRQGADALARVRGGSDAYAAELAAEVLHGVSA
jgi:HEAT repeat protein